jgi:hypothetical protein
MLAGAVLGPAGFGLTAGQAALTAGAIRGATSGSLEKGIAFGLGAYGGAGLSGALLNTGTQMAANTAVAGDLGAAAGDSALTATQAAQAAKASPLSTMGQGAKGLFEKEGRDIFMKEAGGLSGLAQYGYAAAAPALLAPPKTTTDMPAIDREQYKYAYNPGRTQDPEAGYMGTLSGERTHFNPTFQRLADGGVTDDRFSGNAYVRNLQRVGASYPITTPSQKASGLDEDYTYIYDPISKTYKRVPKAEAKPGGDPTALSSAPGVDVGGGIDMGLDSGSTLGGFGHSMGDAGVGAISLGHGLSALGVGLGFNAGATGSGRGGWGDAITNYGIDQLGAAEAQAAADAATAASMGAVASDAASSSNTAGLSAAAAAAEMSAAMDAAAAEAAASGDLAGLNAGDVGAMSGPGDAAAGDLGGMGPGDIGGGDTSGGPGGGDTSGGGADAGGSGDCVDPAVLIMLADGSYVPAGSIEVGDVLFAMHEKTLEFGAYPVEHSEEVQQPKALVLFDDGSNMLVSHSHKFFMVGGEWKQVYQLEPGDTVRAAPGANDKTVIGLEPQGEGPVMKITVKDAHTYISEGLISHNMKAKGGIVRRNMGGGISAYAGGGYNLGDYSDGGRLLRGPGDGVSDSIPAVIGQKRPARLADGEFVVPARIVSELGNGSTEAGARKLYAMMDRVQRARGKTTGKGRVAKNTRADKYLPA